MRTQPVLFSGYYVINALKIAMTAFPPVNLVALALAIYALTTQAELWRGYRERFLKTDFSRPTEAQEIVALGYDLLKLLRSYHDTFSWCINVEYIMNVTNEIFGLFFATLLLNAFENGTFSALLFTIGLGYFIIGIASLMRLATLVLAGNALSDAMRSAKDVLARKIRGNDDMDDKMRYKMEVLLDRMNKPAAVQPENIYDLSISSALLLHGVTFTYIIVLVQFKLT